MELASVGKASEISVPTKNQSLRYPRCLAASAIPARLTAVNAWGHEPGNEEDSCDAISNSVDTHGLVLVVVTLTTKDLHMRALTG